MLSLCACAAVAALGLAGFDADGGFASLEFGKDGSIVSLRENASGRELVATPCPLVVAVGRDGRRRAVTDEVELSVERFYGGWTFRIVSADIKDAVTVEFCRLCPVCTTHVGRLVNGLSDDRSGVVLRAYDVETGMCISPKAVWLGMRGDENLVGRRFGLSAGPRADMPRMLRGMTLSAGLPHSDVGGAWALGAEGNRSSFFMVRDPRVETMDDWIDCAKLCGCTTLHFDWWWEPHRTEGHYTVATNRFPRGLADLRDASLKAHAAGLRTDTHTLSGCIGFADPWVTPHASSNLMKVCSYTLARAVDGTNDVIYVNERPSSRHDYSLQYSSNGNVLRIGTELLQYTGISFERPYAFTGVTRGAFGTEILPHAAGERTDYVWQHYCSFFADPDSPLAGELAAALGRMYADCGFDQVYMDGAEGVANATGVPDERKRDRLLRRIFAAFAANGHAPLWEDSNWTTHGWWFHSRIGSWDFSGWAPRTFLNRHLRDLIPKSRVDNYLEPSLGWWPIKWGTEGTGCYHFDEQEYFAAKMAGHDAAFSLSPWGGSNVTQRPFAVGERRAMTIIGQYERFRTARAFASGVRERLAEPDRDFRLRQDERGLWTLTPVRVDRHRVRGADESRWEVAGEGDGRADLRVEALWGVGAWDGRHVTAISSADVPKMKLKGAPDVTLSCTAAEENGIRPVATNATRSARGAWTSAALEFGHPFKDRDFTGCGAYGVRVKGDGSGAVLNIQTGQGRANGGGLNEHYIRLDFTGWRTFMIPWNREHDAAAYDLYDWPYCRGSAPAYAVYERGTLRPKTIGSLALWLNEVPAGGTVDVTVGEVRALPLVELKLRNVAVTVGDGIHPVPFELKSGEFADLEDGFWTLHSMRGDAVARRPASAVPALRKGRNVIAFAAEADGNQPRAEVTVFGLGHPFPALAGILTDSQERIIAFEPELPVIWAPSKGLDVLPPVKVRPGRTADLELELVGPIDRPELTVGDTVRRFPVTVGATEKLVFGGTSWRVRGPKGAVRANGTFEMSLRPLTGVVSVSLRSADADAACAQVRLFKRYREETP